MGATLSAFRPQTAKPPQCRKTMPESTETQKRGINAFAISPQQLLTFAGSPARRAVVVEILKRLALSRRDYLSAAHFRDLERPGQKADQVALERLWQRGREAWREGESPSAWVDELRGHPDLKIEQIDPPPCSGMQVAAPPNGVIVTHIPTGISATVIGETSQHKNKALAKAMVQFALNKRLKN
jgi:hypothetical protein